MKNSRTLMWALSLVPCFALAGVTLDQGDMPRCISSQNEIGRGLLLKWDTQDHYQSNIQFALIEEITADAAAQVHLPVHYRHLECRDWRGILRSEVALPWRALPDSVFKPSGSKSVAGYEITPGVLRALGQIKAGGNRYRTETTAAEFLTNHPLEELNHILDQKLRSTTGQGLSTPMDEFSIALNRDLSEQYGVHFINEIYRELEIKTPRYFKFREIAMRYLSDPALPSQGLTQAFGKHVFLIGGGLGSDHHTGKVKPLFDFLQKQGLRVEPIRTAAYGRIESNSKGVEAQLRDHLAQGTRVIFTVASKSVPETLAAIARVEQSPPVALPGHELGKIDAVINIAGVVQGSMFSDWFLTAKIRSIAEFFAPLANTLFHTPTGDLDVIKELSQPWIRDWMSSQKVSSSLPKSAIYLDWIPILPRDDQSVDSGILKMRNLLTRKFLREYGANDGYLEYPGTVIPDAWVTRHYTAILDSSHVIFDGSYEGHSAKTETEAVLKSQFLSLAELLN